MTFSWTKQQFVGGHPLFDLINTVCYADNPDLRSDRLSCVEDLSSFVKYGSEIGVWPHNTYALPDNIDNALGLGHMLNIRSSLDNLFRKLAQSKEFSYQHFNNLLKFHTGFGDVHNVDHSILMGNKSESGKVPFAQSIVFDAIKIAVSYDATRLKQCPRCHWLFQDKSRNKSRVWCSMETCGNVAKAKRFQSTY